MTGDPRALAFPPGGALVLHHGKRTGHVRPQNRRRRFKRIGFGIAQSRLRAGHTRRGFNVLPDQTKRFEAEGDATDLSVSLFDAVLVVVPSTVQTKVALFGPDGLLQDLCPGADVTACAPKPLKER